MKYAPLGLLLALLAGCSCFDNLSFRSQSPDEEPAKPRETTLVGNWAVPFGTQAVRIEGVALVSGLNGTGSDPAPSPQRSVLIDDMEARGVAQPNTLLASKNVAMVLVQGYLRPGIRKGDRFDVELRVPGHSDTTSLRGGYLMETRLKDMAVLNNMVHEGHVWALAQGPVMIDPNAESRKDQVMATRGRVLGGGVSLKDRELGLVLKPDHQTVFKSARAAEVINKRFHTFDRGVQVGVANAQTDKFIKLAVHPRYKDNITRYFRVIRSIAVFESDQQRMDRVAQLKQEILDPDTASAAALQLEALGKLGVDPLLAALASPRTEIRFFAAEALAYLDRSEAAQPLGQIARDEPAFRVFALAALSAMDDFSAEEQLRLMLDSTSAETRYGAFRALWVMRPRDPLVVGERLADEFTFHMVDSKGPPMVHVTDNRRPELVLFGRNQRLQTPLAINAGHRILVRNEGTDEICVARFAPNEVDQKRIVSTKLEDVIHAIVDVGGTYPDIVQALQEAKKSGALASRFEIDAVPESGRTFNLANDEEATDAQSAADNPDADSEVSIASPLGTPDMFSKQAGPKKKSAGGDEGADQKPASDEGEKSESRGFFAKLMGR